MGHWKPRCWVGGCGDRVLSHLGGPPSTPIANDSDGAVEVQAESHQGLIVAAGALVGKDQPALGREKRGQVHSDVTVVMGCPQAGVCWRGNAEGQPFASEGMWPSAWRCWGVCGRGHGDTWMHALLPWHNFLRIQGHRHGNVCLRISGDMWLLSR